MLEISKAIFAAPVTRVVLTTPTSAGGNAAVLAALKAPVTARDDRLTAVKADFKELPAFGPPGTITSTSPILGLRAERIEFANGVTALVSNNKVEPGKVRDRKSVVEGKRVSVRVDHGGRRVMKNTKTKQKHKEKPN